MDELISVIIKEPGKKTRRKTIKNTGVLSWKKKNGRRFRLVV